MGEPFYKVDPFKSHPFMMMEVRTKDDVDTRHLNTEAMSKTDALQLFNKNLFLMNLPGNECEKDHLVKDVILPGWGRVLSKRRVERAGKLGKIFPKHHTHKRSKKELVPTVMNITKTNPLQGTSHSDMVKLAFRQQEKNLKNLAHYMDYNPLFMKDLVLIADSDAEEQEREAAEERVMKVYLEYGECIGHQGCTNLAN